MKDNIQFNEDEGDGGEKWEGSPAKEDNYTEYFSTVWHTFLVCI